MYDSPGSLSHEVPHPSAARSTQTSGNLDKMDSAHKNLSPLLLPNAKARTQYNPNSNKTLTHKALPSSEKKSCCLSCYWVSVNSSVLKMNTCSSNFISVYYRALILETPSKHHTQTSILTITKFFSINLKWSVLCALYTSLCVWVVTTDKITFQSAELV